MRVLITGMDGFAGRHLADLLLRDTHWMLIGVSRTATGDRNAGRVQWWKLDLCDADGVSRVIKFERPDLVIHMAAQAHVGESWRDPWETFQNNVRGQLNLFEAITRHGLTPRILIVTSNEVYGAPRGPSDLPFREDRLLAPNNPYGVSKVAQDAMALQYHRSHGLDVVVARPFNHFGPGQNARFVAPQFACRIAEIERGLREPVLRVGNMAAERDFTDVRDVARAYLKLIQLGEPGTVYNVCSGQPRSVQLMLDLMLQRTSSAISVETDPAKYRTADTPVSYGDSTRLRQTTGWAPSIPFDQTIQDILDDWRRRVAGGERSPD